MTESADSRRRRILEATLDVIRDKGLAGVRAQEVARRAGVSAGLLLYHFGTLEGMVAAAMRESEDDYYRSFEDEAAVDLPAPERLRLLVLRQGEPDSVVAAWTLWMEFWVRALRDRDTARLCADLDSRWRAALEAVIEQGVREGVFTCRSPRATTIRLSALLDGLSVAATLGDPEVSVAAVPDLWLETAALELGCDRGLLGLH